MSVKSICFLSLRPSIEYIKFIETMVGHGYDIFLCIDDNRYKPPSIDGITFIQRDNNVCKRRGYWASVLQVPHRACSRDKALYVFCEELQNKYEYIWMIEEDVFVYDIHTIINIDNQYRTGDLLCRQHLIKPVNNEMGWLWNHVKGRINQPWANSMICAIRVSNRLLSHIRAYAVTNHKLFFDEAMFNTIAMQQNLEIITVPELSTIEWRHEWRDDEFIKTNLYHPIKNIKKQVEIRKLLRS